MTDTTTSDRAPEIEGKGLDYERFAINKLFHRLVRQYGLQQVVEIPARGEKAMPSIYSLPFRQAGCEVTIVNGQRKSAWAWGELGYDVTWHDCDELTNSGLAADSADLVWNFMYLAHLADPAALVREMMRLSRRYILFISVNRFNPGFFSHRTVHKLRKVPWNHGDIAFMNPFRTARFLRDCGLRIVERGCVDTPPYPDSLGIRDMKLHRLNRDLHELDWDSRSVHWMKAGKYPAKLHWLYLAERLPLPFLLKLVYAHLFYIVAEKPLDL